MRRSARRRTSSPGSCAGTVVLLAGLLLMVPGPPAVAASCSTVTVPAYFYPGTLWDNSVQPPATVKRTLILNPNSGPGTQQDPYYVDAVSKARAAGATVVGYVHTSYGRRALDHVRADVASYRQFYGVNDVFFDEVSSAEEQLSYYETLSTEVRGAKGMVLLNPGMHPHEGYMPLADQVITFEGTYDTYRRAQMPAWTAKYPASKFTHLVYSTHRRNLGNALSLADRRRAGNVYVTNDSGDNPWDTLPSYWSDELTQLSTSC